MTNEVLLPLLTTLFSVAIPKAFRIVSYYARIVTDKFFTEITKEC